MAIELKNIWKAYLDKQVLSDFSYLFPAGKTTCIMGASGCGKTTLLRLLLGLEVPDSGEILGMEGKKKSAIFQENRLVESISAPANLRLVTPSLSRSQAEQLLTNVGLGDSLHQPVRELSGGMQRRVAILRALAADYDILLADEPFIGLDDATKQQTMELFRQRTAGKTVLLVTHEEKEAEFFGSPVLRL